MRAGDRDRSIQILQKSVTRGGAGDEVITWNVIHTPWAEVIPMGRRERFSSDAIRAVLTSVFKITWRPGLDETMRIAYDGLQWKITGIAEIGRREGLEITAEVVK